MENIHSIISRAREQRSKRLNLSNQNLTELPPEIGELTELQVLWLKDNQLEKLPPEIGRLNKLRWLNLSNNKLLELPNEFGQLINLQQLKLKNNLLSEVPSCITYLTQLKLLSLSHNPLRELSDSLSKLTKLKTLYLNRNELVNLPSFICNLSNLEYLWLSENKLRELPEEISNLSNLKTLFLNNNELSEFPSLICRLNNLEKLALSENKIRELPEEISNLTKLKDLYLIKNELVNLPSSIGSLSNLERLLLYENKISELPEELSQLTNLKLLNLNDNDLSTFSSVIGKLTNLENLLFQNNRISELPEELSQLTNLKLLFLSKNDLSNLPSSIGQLTKLENLLLENNRISELPEELSQLTNLKLLFLSENDLSNLPSSIGKLTNLYWLRLNQNKIRELPEELSQLANLKWLDLDDNDLNTLPSSIGKLSNLESLNLSQNKIEYLPQEISTLKKLERLYFNNNQITKLPCELADLHCLETLQIDRNPNLKFPSPEIVEQGWEAIKSYLQEDLEQLWVTKMLVVGQGSVGKTSLLRLLRGEAFNDDLDSTSGMEIGVLNLDNPSVPGVSMQLNTWDFAGQTINHATHQFFLTNRSLYLVVWNAREGFETGRLYYWLDTIKVRAPQASIILVATHTDQRGADLPMSELKDKYPQIAKALNVSCKTKEGVDELRKTIQDVAASMPLMGEYWPEKWIQVINNLRAKKSEGILHITPPQLTALMEQYEVNGYSRQVLIKWLHDLGEILYFRDVEGLNDTVILDPQWVTKIISRVLESDDVKKNGALFTRKHMDELWKDIDEPWMREYMVRMMDQFDLSYEVANGEDNKKKDGDRDKSLVVEMLPLDEADYKSHWDQFKDQKSISMKFDLKSSLPAGIPTWFIARSHRFTTRTHWRYGALFTDHDKKHLGLIQAFTHDNSLRLTVRGPIPMNFFALLRDGLELTLRRFEGLDIERFIPCPGHNNKFCSHEFPLSLLEKLMRSDNPRKEALCYETAQDVSIAEMLFGVQLGLGNNAIFDTLLEQNKEVLAGIQDLKGGQDSIREYFQREFTKLFNSEQSKEETSCPNLFIIRGSSREGDLTGLFEPIRSYSMMDDVREKVWKQRMELQLYCQAPGYWHPLGYERGKDDPKTGLYQIEVSSSFLRKVAPLLSKAVKIMKFAPIITPCISWTDLEKYEKQIKEDVTRVKSLVDGLSKTIERSPEEKMIEGLGDTSMYSQVSISAMSELRALLLTKDKDRIWGGLSKMMTKEGHWLWLCSDHYHKYKSNEI